MIGYIESAECFMGPLFADEILDVAYGENRVIVLCRGKQVGYLDKESSFLVKQFDYKLIAPSVSVIFTGNGKFVYKVYLRINVY